jgi:S-layer like family, C-terminal region.
VFGGSTASVRRFSTDSSEVDGLPDDLISSLPASEPALVLIEEERQNGEQEAYTVTASFDTDEDELEIDSPAYSGTDRQISELESREDVVAGVDRFGTYTEFGSDDRDHVLFRYPEVQSKAGAMLGSEDSSIESVTPGFAGADELGVLDTDANPTDTHHILVGGPASNSQVRALAARNRTMSASEYDTGEALIQLVEDAPSYGQQSLVVAGHSASDTRRAATRLADADLNPLPGRSQVKVSP